MIPTLLERPLLPGPRGRSALASLITCAAIPNGMLSKLSALVRLL